MRKTTRLLLSVGAVGLAAPAVAQAQGTVYCENCTDEVTTLTDQIAVLAQWGQQLASMTQQIEEMIQIYHQLSGLTNVNGMVAVLNQAGNWNAMNSMGNVPQILQGGAGGAFGAAGQFQLPQMPVSNQMPLLTAMQGLYNQRTSSLAGVQGIAYNLMGTANTVLAGLQALQLLIDGQPSAQQMLGINARLQSYQGNIASQQYQLQQAQMFANAQARVMDEREKNAVSCSYYNWFSQTQSISGGGLTMTAPNCPGGLATPAAAAAPVAQAPAITVDTGNFDTPLAAAANPAATGAPAASPPAMPTAPATAADPAADPATETPLAGLTTAMAPGTQPAAYTDTACGAANTGAAGPGFTTAGGEIIGPNGQPFTARGVDVLEGNQPSAATLEADFPGINYVRLAIYDYASPASLAPYINDLTSHGIVVELEDHTNSSGQNAGGGNQGGSTIFTGAELANENAWYSSIASAFANNPYVWFGTDNEPATMNAATGQNDPAALSAWQLSNYNAVRSTGNTSPILLEDAGASMMVPSYYAGMTNTVIDDHFYGWEDNYNADPGTVAATLNSSVDQIQQAIPGKNGTMPVIIGEYGNSTDGNTIDANGNQVIQAVQQSGYGAVAWMYADGNADALLDGNGGLSAFGQSVAAFTSSGSASPCPNTAPATATTWRIPPATGWSLASVAAVAWTRRRRRA